VADDDGVVLSVRGEAHLTVAPDAVQLTGVIVVWRDGKAEALGVAADVLQRVTTDLAGLGGVPLSVEASRPALAWSAFSATSSAERWPNKETGRAELTGRVAATVNLRTVVRDFDLLDPLAALLARHEEVEIHQVTWEVDEDNPGWRSVRSDAIQAALRKGRDYADALGVSLSRVEQVADTGLLAGTAAGAGESRRSRAMSGFADGAGGDTPSLDPVPQQLTAVIEARLVATPATLPS
jgi:uncharacterized protein YggE